MTGHLCKKNVDLIKRIKLNRRNVFFFMKVYNITWSGKLNKRLNNYRVNKHGVFVLEYPCTFHR